MADINHEEGLSLLSPDSGYKVYRRRWIMLAIFTVFSVSNNFLWLQYASISDTVAAYYDVSTTTVDILSSVYFAVYIVAILPVMWLTEKSNLKVVLLLGTSLQCIGSWIRFAGTLTHSITLNFIGQILCGIGQPCNFGMSSQMAGTWFGIDEVSLASGIGFAGVEIGIGLAFIIPPLVVHDGPGINHQMTYFFQYTAIVMSCILPLTIFVFEAKPPLPPSRPKKNVIKAGKQENYLKSIKAILRNRNFVLLLVAFAFFMGLTSALATKLKDFLSSFLDSSIILRRIGIAKIFGGVMGPLIAGFWLDRSKTFRSTTLVLCISTAVTILSFSISLNYANSFFTTVSIGLYWFIIATFFTVGCEHAVELTYPESEIISSGLLNAANYVVAILLVFIFDFILSGTSLFVRTSFCCIVPIIPVISTVFIGSNNRRQHADQDNYQEENMEIQSLENPVD